MFYFDRFYVLCVVKQIELKSLQFLIAGAVSVSHHMLNEESKKYFQQAILMSGTANSYKMYIEGNHRCLMQIFAKKYEKWIGDNFDEFIELLKNLPEQQILDFSAEIQRQPHDKLEFEVIPTPNGVWWPMVEGAYDSLKKIMISKCLLFFSRKRHSTISARESRRKT